VVNLRVFPVVESSDLQGLKNEWNALVEAAGLSIFQTFEWITTWWRWFGRSPLRVITVWDRERLVGVFPVYFDTSAPAAFRAGAVLRFAGRPKGEHPEILAPGYEAPVAEALASELTRSLEWDQVDLRSVPAGSRFSAPFLAALQRHGCRAYLYSENQGKIVRLPTTWDEYAARLSPRTRRDVAKKLDRLKKGGAVFELAGRNLSLEFAIEEFIRLHRSQESVKGWTTYENPSAQQFLREVVASLDEVGATRLIFLRIGTRRIAGALSFISRPTRVAYGYQCGMAPGSWASCSPGIILRFHAIRDAISCGMQAYDVFEGNEPYKALFEPETVTYRRYLVAAPTISAKLRMTAWWNGRRLLHSVRARHAAADARPLARHR
jgi:CelD/BcsL family acetyltransferase involved in cellulose biosynthesis